MSLSCPPQRPRFGSVWHWLRLPCRSVCRAVQRPLEKPISGHARSLEVSIAHGDQAYQGRFEMPRPVHQKMPKVLKVASRHAPSTWPPNCGTASHGALGAIGIVTLHTFLSRLGGRFALLLVGVLGFWLLCAFWFAGARLHPEASNQARKTSKSKAKQRRETRSMYNYARHCEERLCTCVIVCAYARAGGWVCVCVCVCLCVDNVTELFE